MPPHLSPSQYNITRRTTGDFDSVVARVKDALKTEGFGVLAEIDVAGTLKAKIDKDFRPYRILGACNPNLAYEALTAEALIGVMLPCNVIVQRYDNGEVEVSSIDPATAMAVGRQSRAVRSRGQGARRAEAGDRERLTKGQSGQRSVWSGAITSTPGTRALAPAETTVNLC